MVLLGAGIFLPRRLLVFVILGAGPDADPVSTAVFGYNGDILTIDDVPVSEINDQAAVFWSTPELNLAGRDIVERTVTDEGLVLRFETTSSELFSSPLYDYDNLTLLWRLNN